MPGTTRQGNTRFAHTPNTVTVGASAALALAGNINRTALLITNTSANACRLGFSTAVSATTGFRIAPNATVLLTGPACPTAPIFGIRESADATLSFGEVEDLG